MYYGLALSIYSTYGHHSTVSQNSDEMWIKSKSTDTFKVENTPYHNPCDYTMQAK